DPDPRGEAAAGVHGLDRPCLPPRRDRRDALPDLPPVRGARHRSRHHARRPEGDAAARHARPVRRGARGALPHALLPVHRAVDGAGRLVRRLRRQRLRDVRLVRLARDRRLRHGRPAGARERRARPGGVGRLRVRARARAGRAAPLRHPAPAAVLGERSPLPEAVQMRVPLSWLREYVDVDADAATIAEALTISTAEVPTIERRGPADTTLFVVGRVLEADKHPNADRLQLCRVDVGEGKPAQIVCGAWNFGAGATVAVARPGATLPNGLTLERRELRGEMSEGMILAEDEIELGADHSGIIVLPDGLEPGSPLAAALPLVEEILDVDPTGNRVDLLSVYGIAREVAALFEGELRRMPGTDPQQDAEEDLDIRIEDFEGCPRYVGRLFRDVTIAESPLWLKARLRDAGVRSISNVVDVTNYVMLALGNPLHAFDFETLDGGRIAVRRARKAEKLTTLDGTERELGTDDLVIADAKRAVALAGIMGGEETEVSDGTTSVLLEAANFEPVGILRSSERLALRTEGSNRWEKGVDPHLAGPAAALATQLIVELAGARWVAAADVQGELPQPAVLPLRTARANELLGVEIAAQRQEEILARVGFEREKDGFRVPTWRARDVTR